MEAKLSGAASNVVQQRSWRALVDDPQEYSWKSLTECSLRGVVNFHRTTATTLSVAAVNPDQYVGTLRI